MATRKNMWLEKYCNLCGNECMKYSVSDNAPICEKCVPMKKQKKIINESKMVNKIMEVNDGNKKL